MKQLQDVEHQGDEDQGLDRCAKDDVLDAFLLWF